MVWRAAQSTSGGRSASASGDVRLSLTRGAVRGEGRPAGLLYGRINWRVPRGNQGDFLARSVVQTFRQQEDPSVLYNHNNAYLHYEDDWCGAMPLQHRIFCQETTC